MAGLDDAGVNRAHRNPKDAFAERGTIDVLFAFERRQHGVDGKVFAQRMHVGPVVVQGDAARVGMALGLDAEPVLNLALLPVDGGKLGGQRGKRGMLRGNGSLQNQPGWIARLVEDIIKQKTPSGAAFDPRRRRRPGAPILVEKTPCRARRIRPIDQDNRLAGDALSTERICCGNAREVPSTKVMVIDPLTTARRAAESARAAEPGSQNPMTTSTVASASSEPSRQGTWRGARRPRRAGRGPCCD